MELALDHPARARIATATGTSNSPASSSAMPGSGPRDCRRRRSPIASTVGSTRPARTSPPAISTSRRRAPAGDGACGSRVIRPVSGTVEARGRRVATARLRRRRIPGSRRVQRRSPGRSTATSGCPRSPMRCPSTVTGSIGSRGSVDFLMAWSRPGLRRPCVAPALPAPVARRRARGRSLREPRGDRAFTSDLEFGADRLVRVYPSARTATRSKYLGAMSSRGSRSRIH